LVTPSLYSHSSTPLTTKVVTSISCRQKLPKQTKILYPINVTHPTNKISPPLLVSYFEECKAKYYLTQSSNYEKNFYCSSLPPFTFPSLKNSGQPNILSILKKSSRRLPLLPVGNLTPTALREDVFP